MAAIVFNFKKSIPLLYIYLENGKLTNKCMPNQKQVSTTEINTVCLVSLYYKFFFRPTCLKLFILLKNLKNHAGKNNYFISFKCSIYFVLYCTCKKLAENKLSTEQTV